MNAASGYNLHQRHAKNNVKIGNWVEERALIESAPGMCVPEWGDTDAEGNPVRWSKHHRKPDHHDTTLLTGSFNEEVKLASTTHSSFTPQVAHTEPKVGMRESLMAQALMDVARDLPQDPVPPTDYTTSSDSYKKDVQGPPPIAPGESLLNHCPLTAYTYNGKYSIKPDGNFSKNSDFSTPPELYLKATMK